MRASVMTAPGNVVIRDADRPTPAPGEVLVQIKRIGICGSDLHVFHGHHPYTSYPVVQGHEVSGVVAEVGSDAGELVVENVVRNAAPAVGTKVTIRPQLVCGECYPCRHGEYEVCDELKVMGFQAPGAGAEFFAAPVDTIVPLPPGMSFDAGAMIEPLAVAVHAVHRTGRPVDGQKVVVIGAGTIGNLVGQTAKALGAAQVMAVDLSTYRLDLVSSLGADVIVDAADTGRSRDTLDAAKVAKVEFLSDKVVEGFGPDKADVIFECVGAEMTVNQAIHAARKGTEIILVGVVPGLPAVNMGFVQDRQLKIVGTLMYRHEDFVEAIDLVQRGAVQLEPLISHHFPFEQYADAYRYADENRTTALKVMIDV